MDVSHDEKTVVMGTHSKLLEVSNGKCPVCNAELQLSDQTGKMICPACGYTNFTCCNFQPGDILNGKYRILSLLGSGGCGNVFLCHPLENISVRYVVKVLKNGDQPGLQERFIREAKLLKAINNDRIVQVIDYWTNSSGSFTIFEYVKGKTLKELRAEFLFGEESTLLTAREIALALQFAYDNFSVIHRDIKPDNIMLDENNHIKLLDFGLSKKSGSGSLSDITMEHAGLGTPGYMSPEQFHDFKHAGFRSDIFSLGATMFLLLTGERPFEGNDLQTIYNNTISNSPPPSERLAPYCSEGCTQLIQWMMQQAPEQRPASYAELIQAIDKLLGN